ncbi:MULTISPECIES: AtpZ/AtpI family protein [Flavobacterium]|jgi:succinate dehydrogenase hydrophobic anchor subunit|uniref:F0F1-ATPase subunit (Ca2+/Mg2+ transporter) n=1 Tax=Flavobacterium lindanitolerans TaxID=428988 RepID=A0A497V500_9FLAO|nr:MULTISPECIES: AtpZ/AtpI family protein [Flavobacterium]MBU7569355.1 AtpZ/AtpI family protein [Flavobacterium sp.]PZO27283.1 MAG: F0F1-ATPase subunit [Flavobacteriaceae bacterium]PZQ92406.1 MAG: F0F1-ATPase subunit [Flavobacterium johnsoniae]KQS52766.1 F0F1-ATPase subunit [Flavobacterium sp. Leaf359]MBL7867760.1 AtpZ/AtpI family protein [Flavobacterium lindanitolerans]
MENNDQKKKSLSKWAALMNIPFQMGIIIFAFTYLGMWLDEKYSNNSSTWTIVLSLLSVFIALYNVIRQVKNLNKK